MSNIEEIINSYIYVNRDTKERYPETHRFNSWDICFKVFQEHFKNNRVKGKEDFLALNLGMYLASWGMMRGSTELLQFSYKIHEPIIKKLYDFYKNEIPFAYSFDTEYMEKLMSKKECIYNFSKNELFKAYEEVPNWEQKKYDTLTTKILLGVFGITPAYDEFLKKGMGESSIQQSFSSKSLGQLISFYNDNIGKFKQFDKLSFPPMKLVDMYFWQLGFDLEEEQEKK